MRFFPDGYRPLLSNRETERAIKIVKDLFEKELSGALRLSRVTSPLFVPSGSGINDDLNGVERPVRFPVGKLAGQEMEIVQSLAKWKRMALADYGYSEGYGLYTDMNALRPDDDIDEIHSIYVDQWDWEQVIPASARTIETLKETVREIYSAIKRTEFLIHETYECIKPCLPKEITFIHSEDPPVRGRRPGSMAPSSSSESALRLPMGLPIPAVPQTTTTGRRLRSTDTSASTATSSYGTL